jgi:hypothetical protein
MNKENFILKIYAITLTLILGFILLSGFISNPQNERFDEITVERINIVEPDGKLKMVLSNQERQHPGMMDGTIYEARERAPGILFFNEEQDEIGGLGYNGNKEEGGNNVYLSFDQYKNDQVMQLMHLTNRNGDNRYGLVLWERDKELTMAKRQSILDSLEREGYNYRQKFEYLKEQNGGEPILEQRLFVGKNYNREAGLFIKDKYGVDRLRFYIDTDNSPKIEVLDEEGKIIKNIIDN